MQEGNWDKRPKSYILKHASRIVRRHVRLGASILDVGCGKGDFLRMMEGFTVTGCDVEKYSDHGSFFLCNLNESIAAPGNTYDLVTAWNVVEHLENPWFAIREVKRILKPGGHFIFSIPNTFSLKNKLRFLFSGEFSRYNETNDHKMIFTKKTLEDFCAGFEVAEKGFVGSDGFGSLARILSPELRGHTCYVVLKKQ